MEKENEKELKPIDPKTSLLKFSERLDKFDEKYLSKSIVVIDSLRDFILGDISDNKFATDFFEKLKKIRKTGAIVIFLNYLPKNSKLEGSF